MNFAQVQYKSCARMHRDGLNDLVYGFGSEMAAKHLENFAVSEVLPGEPEEMPATRARRVTGRIRGVDPDFRATDGALVGPTPRGS